MHSSYRSSVLRAVLGGVLATAVAAGAAAQDRTAPGAACDRECLRGAITTYLNALVARNPSAVPVAQNVRFTEDTVERMLGEGLWQTATRLRPYRQDFLDVRHGIAATFAIVEEGNAPVMLFLRLKLADGKITEVETQVTRNQKDGLLFEPEALKAPSPAMLIVPPPAQRNSRADAIRIAEGYPAGLKIGSFVTADTSFVPDAYRFENGRMMAGPACTFAPGCDNIKTQRIPTLPEVTYRVGAVDEEMGLVLLRLDFGAGSVRDADTSLIVWEAFKVYGDQIHAVEAFMKAMPRGASSGWDSSDAR